ncbi:hypothetical protein MTY59_45600 [Mycobacterium senriense]|uniref:Transposase n=1 Tax=Mycobacterium senriense TaxID=2775496 RepID=A0ABM7SW45_9MYCO|nr:hypothetical protein MTY59_45600 [Mycobacterium senriense]
MVPDVLDVMGRLVGELPRLLHQRGNGRGQRSATTAITANSTTVTAAQRATFFPTNHHTAGSSPKATKKATPIKRSIDDTAARPRTALYVTATPADAVRPTKNGECQSNRRRGGPTG